MNLVPVYQHQAKDGRYYYDTQKKNAFGWSEGVEIFYAYDAAFEPGTVPIYRHESAGRYYYDTNLKNDFGWSDGVVAFYAFTRPLTGTIPIYEHESGGQYFIDTNFANHFGWGPGVLLCYAYSTRHSWMTLGFDSIKNLTLTDLALPGSHDAGMYTSGYLTVFDKTQDLTIYQQLVEGIRYFDLRPSFTDKQTGNPNDNFFVYHGPWNGPSLLDILNDVVGFMSDHGRELVLLKFSHYRDFTDARYVQLMNLVAIMLGPWLYTQPLNVRLAKVPMQDFIGTQGRVLVLCDGGYPINNPYAGVFVYRDWSSRDPQAGHITVYDEYSNSMNAYAVMADQLNKFAAFDGRCQWSTKVPCDLFLLSWTVTLPTGVWVGAQFINSYIHSKVKGTVNPNSYGKFLNVIYVDFVEYGDPTRLCLELNGLSF